MPIVKNFIKDYNPTRNLMSDDNLFIMRSDESDRAKMIYRDIWLTQGAFYNLFTSVGEDVDYEMRLPLVNIMRDFSMGVDLGIIEDNLIEYQQYLMNFHREHRGVDFVDVFEDDLESDMDWQMEYNIADSDGYVYEE